jgi:DNA sulfur modification protein DndE
MPPAQFFAQSWIITFAGAHDTQKNLAAYMLLDTLNTFPQAHG